MYKQHVEMLVCVNGKPVREYRHGGQVFIEARNGTEYSVKLKNNAARRALIILSVDGLEVLKGKKADETNSGYVLEGFSQLEIKGYRTSDTTVAQFIFNDGTKSYATLRGREMGEVAAGETAKNNGVIGVRVILEKVKVAQPVHIQPTVWRGAPNTVGKFVSTTGCLVGLSNAGPQFRTPIISSTLRGQAAGIDPTWQAHNGGLPDSYTTCSSVENVSISATNPVLNAGEAVFAAGSIPAFNMGTQFGASVESKVKQVDFEMSSDIFEMSLYYTSRESLIAAGVDLSDTPKYYSNELPKAFGTSYCPAPKN